MYTIVIPSVAFRTRSQPNLATYGTDSAAFRMNKRRQEYIRVWSRGHHMETAKTASTTDGMLAMEISNISAMVTGGASGLGAATVKALAAGGAKVAILDMNQEAGQALASELGESVTFVKTDVTSETEVLEALAAAQALAPLRVVVNCAGIGWATRTVNREGVPHPLDLFNKVIQVNLVGTFNVMRLSAAAMAQNGPLEHNERGVIINTASVAAFDGQIGQIAYSASKSGVAGMTLPAARDLSKIGVRVLTIAPGIFETPMLALLPEAHRNSLAAGVPFPQRLGMPEDYAKLALSMIDNGYLNGETIRLDGSLRMAPK